MSPALEQLVREAMELTGAQQPSLMEDDSPVLADEALAHSDDAGFYLVGLIGGKDVGKSALVNALVGKAITAVTSHGAGTEIAIAYAHRSQELPLRALLDREVPGQYRLVLHDQPGTRRQVLLDLPDIDSKYASHLAVTRAMLRHMLYPIWVSSVEKYADLQPQQMLAKVSEGNTPANFLFCLTKADQLGGGAGWAPARGDSEKVASGAGTGDEKIGKDGPKAADVASQSASRGSPTAVGPPWTEGTLRALTSNLQAAVGKSQAPILPTTPTTVEFSPPPARPDPLKELRDDYAGRVQRTLKLDTVPRVFLVSSRLPQQFDMQTLRELVCEQRTDEAIREAKQLAAARQDRALLTWLDGQDLRTRCKRLEQLQRDADELLANRVGTPILERVIPRLLDDPGTKSAMADDILQERIARWPVVNLIHTLLQPLYLVIRSAITRGATPLMSADALVDSCVKESGESVIALVQTAFAQLRQQQPIIATLYGQNKLWETMGAEFAAGSLHRALADAVRRQRTTARERLLNNRRGLGSGVRWTVTVGALVWFPFIQPVLAAVLGDPTAGAWHFYNLVALVVKVLGVDYLLRSVTFLLIYFTTLWLALRWNTQRRVTRLLARWKAADYPDPEVNLATRATEWLAELTSPLRAARDRMRVLAESVEGLRTTNKAA